VLAARASVLIPAGESAAFLAPHPIGTLALAAMERTKREAVEDLVSVLTRLGIETLGAFTALPFPDVLARFGPVGAWAHRVARGEDVAPPVLRRAEEDIAVEYVFEEPAQNSEQLVPVARLLAERLDAALLDAGMRCGKVRIVAGTERGQQLERVWRTDVGARAGAFANHMADRVRWQLEGWLSGTSDGPERSGLTSLGVVAEDVVPLGSEQSYLWGGVSGADSRAQRTLERVQGLLGPDGVLAVREQGGRSPRERVLALPWGQEAAESRPLAHPWPGGIPDPAPATVLATPAPVEVLDAGGTPVTVDRRLAISAPPTWVRLEADPNDERARAANRHPASGHVGQVKAPVWDRPRPVEAWAGPWPIAQRWWSGDASRGAYLQVSLGDRAVLVAFKGGQWMLEAVYD
jgi:protein ImuB